MIGGYIGKAIGEPMRRTVLQVVVANITAGVSIVKDAAKIVTAALGSLLATISTYRRHPGKPLLSRRAGRRGYWRGTR